MVTYTYIRDAILEVEHSRRRSDNARRLKAAFRNQELAMAGLEKAVQALTERIRQHESEAARPAPIRAYGLEPEVTQ